MNRLLLGIRICLTVGLALAVTALARQWLSGSCGACSSSGFPAIPLAGTVLYGLLLIVSLRVSELGVLGWGIALAVTAHGVLMAVQLLEGRSCLLCLVAALNALALLGISLAWDARNWIRLLVVLPLGLVALLLIPSPKQEPPFIHHEIVSKPGSSGWSAPVQIVVFENARCPYCDELRQRLVPAITREFGPRVSWFFRNASELPEIRNTPTVVVVPSDRTKSGSVIEGLPTVDVLSSVIRKALPASGGEVR